MRRLRNARTAGLETSGSGLCPCSGFVRCGQLTAVVCFHILPVFVSQRVNIPPPKKRNEKKEVLSASWAEASLCPRGRIPSRFEKLSVNHRAPTPDPGCCGGLFFFKKLSFFLSFFLSACDCLCNSPLISLDLPLFELQISYDSPLHSIQHENA